MAPSEAAPFIARRPPVIMSNLQIFVQGMLFVLLIQFCMLALGYLIPNYTQLANGASATLSGLLLLPGCLLGACIEIGRAHV